MTNLQNRINLLLHLKLYIQNNPEELAETIERASLVNPWFTPQFIRLSLQNICDQYLQEPLLTEWVKHYCIDDNISSKNVGIVMAGNIPLVGFHDFLCVFICGHKQTIKMSSKDNVLLKHFVEKMTQWNSEVAQYVTFSELLKDCDAYIATGSNNSARYFEYYFSKYPSIIRKNRTSVAVLTGNESKDDLEKLSSDIHNYFGLGCRNVTKLYVPAEYDFIPLLDSFNNYKYFLDHDKYKNNFDYNLTIQLMNNNFYMTNGSTLMVESESIFSPISQVNYEFYSDYKGLIESLKLREDIQCIVGIDIPFGLAQTPSLYQYADGIDTMQFLLTL